MQAISGNHDMNKNRFFKTRLMIVMIAIVVGVVFLFSIRFPYKPIIYWDLKSSQNQLNSENFLMKPNSMMHEECHWYFFNYTPSMWESFWFTHIKTLQVDVCGNLAHAENLNKTIVLMQRLVALQKFGRNLTRIGQEASDELLSKMFYRQRCFNSRTNTFYDAGEVSQFIEPLIGLLRDPFSVCGRLDESRVPSTLYDGATLLSRRFLLLSITAPYTISSNSLFPSDVQTNKILPWMYDRSKKDHILSADERKDKRIILLDLGSSYFGSNTTDISDTSTRWLYEHFKTFGLKFDRIIAYEAAALDAKMAWEQLPDDVFPIYTFINTGCTATGILNPWKTLQGLARKEDHVVVKVDIDTFDLENILMDQALNDSNIYSLIDELFFEHHVSVKEMLAYWRPPPGSLSDSYILFTKLRQLGIRMHSWP